ncbi:MAG: class I SAM-dependent rRNA methyltransferase [Synergistaceae bacterium]|nr:class I SAM-dependent rRNA methyltransferase [Synergistaceae bacterium]
MASVKKQLRRALLNDSGLERIKRRHPWIFRGNLVQAPLCAPGDLVAVADRRGVVSGWGLWSESALCLRMLTFGSHEPDQMELLRRRVERALDVRRLWCAGEEAFRWVHGEGDGLPGVTADLYGDVLSLQLSAIGWYRHADEVAKIFRKVKKLSAIVLRNDTKHLEKEGIPREIKPLLGDMPDAPLRLRIGESVELVDIAGGQKTGAYLDVRRLPALLDPLYKDARVLDCFSYQGHFTLRALKMGAAEATAIDQSQAALDRARENISLNGLSDSNVNFRCGNAFDILREIDAERRRYDLVIMDPPPFSPARGQLDSARRGYKELALRGFRRLESGGHMLFLSCSNAFTRDMLLDTLHEAARDAGSVCRLLNEIHQPPDHPALLGVPETDYLKGFVMGVEE